MTSSYHYQRGNSPLIISMPHVGTDIPADILAGMTAVAAHVDDTDWHLPQLYDFAGELDATLISAKYSRYVIDLNRPEDDSNLYPGKKTTELCPLSTFAEEALYPAGREPDADERGRRVAAYWRPYHTALQQEIARAKAQHGYALLWDAHSIRGEVPRLFEGRLPQYNLGTADASACPDNIALPLLALAVEAVGQSEAVLNGRFKGGHITRHYGKPDERVLAVQLELVQAGYMQEQRPYAYDVALAGRMQPTLRQMLGRYAELGAAYFQTMAG